MVTSTLNAVTFIYAPWLALVNGSLGLTTGSSQSAGPESNQESSRFVTGKIQVALFPRSRFPADFRYEVGDTRTDTSLGGGVDYRSTSFAIAQRYRPPKDEFSVSGSYERRGQDSAEFGRDSQQSLLADFSTRWKRHQLSAGLARSTNRRGSTGEETDLISLVARHSFSPDTTLSIESSANWVRTDDQLLSGENASTIVQASSLAVWRSDQRPLTVTGSLRAFSFQRGTSESDNVSAGLGASYELNRNARLNGSLLATRSNGQTAVNTIGALSGNYQGDQRQWNGFQWGWFGGASLSTQFNNAGNDTSLTTQLGHNLNRAWVIDRSTWSVGLGQNIGVSLNSRSERFDDPLLDERVSKTLTQTLAFSWSRPGESGPVFARLTLADARQFDGEQAKFQQVDFQLSGTHDIDRHRSWSASLSAQSSVQRSLQVLQVGDAASLLTNQRQRSHSAGGEVTWRHNRMFDVPRLNFSSRLHVSMGTQRSSDQLLPLPDRETAAWENKLDYRVGRLESSVSLRVSRVDGRQQVFAMWRLQRSFGG